VTANIRRRARLAELQQLAIDVGHQDFSARYPAPLTPVVALICAYEEEANLGPVLAKVPSEACGLAVTALVVVDGGTDRTEEVARASGAATFVLPVNLGHGVALRVGYRLCLHGGADYVITLDADGQNDPGELEVMLQPLVDDVADFVVASRRLGVDRTDDSYRKAGVVVFARIMNLLNGTHLTDTSNGYRGLRAAMLADVVDCLEQDQYQTAELLTTCARRGWRLTERPTVWHPRSSGRSKKGANLLYGLRYANVLWRTWWRERRA
jgi:glycosyltransferase involved in cell wall biosynthesis